MNAIIGFASIFWHIGQIALGRPAFTYLKDTPLTSFAFLYVFFVTGLLRHYVLGGADFVSVASSLGIQVFIYFFAVRWFFKIKTGYALVSVLAGASVFVDILAMFFLLIGFSVGNIKYPFRLLDMGYAILCVMAYNRHLKKQKLNKDVSFE